MEKTKNPNFNIFLIFWLGSLFAAIGSGMTSYIIGIYILESTKTVTLKSIISLLAFLPTILLSPITGSLADKYDRRKLMILGDGLSAIGVLLILISIKFLSGNYILIAIGVLISAIFSSVIEPASKATITDLVNKDDYTKASGMIQLTNSARFLISPILSVLLWKFFGIEAVLLIDIFTIFITIISVYIVSKNISNTYMEENKEEPLLTSFKYALKTINLNKGIRNLILASTIMVFSLAFIQELSVPMLLAFTNKEVISYLLTFSALGMVFGSIFLGSGSKIKNPLKTLFISLFLAGLFMVTFGLKENIIWIGFSGFLFILNLPFANASIDYLVRTNIDNKMQGRIWSIIGLVSRLGFILAMVISGPLADCIFIPILKEDGILASSLGKIIGVGKGRGIGLLIILAGILLALTSVFLYQDKNIRKLNHSA